MTITVQPAKPKAGDLLTITVTSSSRAGTSVTVEITNGKAGVSKKLDSVTVDIDDQGSGSAVWVAPAWDQASFNDGSCDEVVVFIGAKTQPTSEAPNLGGTAEE